MDGRDGSDRSRPSWKDCTAGWLGGGPEDLLPFTEQHEQVTGDQRLRRSARDRSRGLRAINAATLVRHRHKRSHFPNEKWRRRPDLNRGWRFCRPLPYLLATAPRKRAPSFARTSISRLRRASRLDNYAWLASRSSRRRRERRAQRSGRLHPPSGARVRRARAPGVKMERETGFEPATSTLARSHSTTELFPPGEPLNYHEPEVRLKPSARDGQPILPRQKQLCESQHCSPPSSPSSSVSSAS